MSRALEDAVADSDRLFQTQIRPDFLGPVEASRRPTAVIVAGQPGTAKHTAATVVEQHLTPQVGRFAVISGDYLRHYRVLGGQTVEPTGVPELQVRSEVAGWYGRLVAEAIDNRANILLVTSMRQPLQAAEMVQRMHAAGYETSTVVLATHRDHSLLSSALLHDRLHEAGGRPAPVSEAAHEDAYQKLRDWVLQVESKELVNQLQILDDDGRQLHANRQEQGTWARPTLGLKALDDYRERRLTARELADIALQWQVLAQRFTANPDMDRGVASQVVAWRNDATSRAQTDPEASRLLALGLTAQAFLTMDPHQFVREFPKYDKVADKMQQAIDYAQKNLPLQTDRDRFVAEARARLAERIAEGRFPLGRNAAVPSDPAAR
jgi:hypothetical protein